MISFLRNFGTVVFAETNCRHRFAAHDGAHVKVIPTVCVHCQGWKHMPLSSVLIRVGRGGGWQGEWREAVDLQIRPVIAA